MVTTNLCEISGILCRSTAGGVVLKENFNMIKMALKEWHVSHTQNLSSMIGSLKVRLSTLDSGELWTCRMPR
jgi:hypothetical protein